MKVAACQLDITWEDKPANYAKVRTLVHRAGLPSGSLLVLPEMFATGFSMNVGAIIEREGAETELFLQSIAREHGVFVIGGLAGLDSTERARNRAVAVSPAGDILVRYNKIQPFTLGGEAANYSAGDQIFTFKWHQCTVAPFVCYDLRFPELFRAAIDRGAQLFPVIANWPVMREKHWVTLLQARAIENQTYVVGVNRCGTDPKFTYPGRSMIVDHHGEILIDAERKEQLISAEVDLEALETWRRDFPVLQDRHFSS